jgi:predicted nucleotidyltransferase
MEAVAALAPGTGDALVKALRTEGLIEASGKGAWAVTQAGRTFSAATAAKPITRATAEKALAEFLERVTQVNEDPYRLAKATRVILFGSMLQPEVERLSDVDLAVELVSKEVDRDLTRLKNRQRTEELADQGRGFRKCLEWAAVWYFEAFRYLKGGGRVISLAHTVSGPAAALYAPPYANDHPALRLNSVDPHLRTPY